MRSRPGQKRCGRFVLERHFGYFYPSHDMVNSLSVYQRTNVRGTLISKAFVESTVNYVVAKRFTKRQQMPWSPEEVHLLFHMRTQVLNGELEQMFRDWYPCFRVEVIQNSK